MATSIFLMLFLVVTILIVSLFFIKSPEIRTAVLSAALFLVFAALTVFVPLVALR